MSRKKDAVGKREIQAAASVEQEVAPEEHAMAFPVVGIGASAGGLAAFEAFFSGMPAESDPGMAFVLVQHLAPDQESILSDLIQRYTRMKVFEIEDGMEVRPNCVYIIPPGHDLAFLNGALQLLDPVAPRGQRLPIDFFFRSLAQDQHQRAIGIVLSGTGSDGTLGARAIKGEGGMVMAQRLDSTEFDSMPRGALATGLVDFELLPAEMPAQLIAYAGRAFNQVRTPPETLRLETENSLQKIFILLRSQTGHDFSQYKPSTICRRIERRLAVHGIEKLEAYVKFLQETPAEVEALFRDILIGVTNFFRDPEAFQVLEQQVIPKLLANKPAGGVLRVWTAGCSTGEEAYSIAILLQERMEQLKQSHALQVFATDIDSRAIATARAGIYPASIAADVTEERLARFFIAEPDGSGYRIHKGIRDMLIFSEHDLIKDPPFSRLDLISCRNLMIYLGGELQRKLIHRFHYALNPHGVLFLGTAEGVGDSNRLFAVLDRRSKLYERTEDLAGVPRAALGRFMPPLSAIDAAIPPRVRRPAFPAKLPLRELTEQALLKEIAPAGALVNAQGDILYLHGRAGMYLEMTSGEVTVNNILKMAREGLLPSLATALHKAVGTKDTIRAMGLRIKTNGHYTVANLSVHPVISGSVAPPESPLYLVVLEEVRATEQAPQAAPSRDAKADSQATDAEARIAALKLELRAKEEYLQSTHEELESSTEEMQSVNEELQSTNEELETSKEELQSLNEELGTVNVELHNKVADLSRANNDMNNLLAGTGIGTVFVDHQLRILRFTPAASVITNMILSDVGRPVAHIVSNLIDYDHLVADVKEVLNTLVPKEAEVQTRDGKWYTLRILPYRTLDNVIEGAVMTFVDITEMWRTREELQQATALLRLAVVVRDAHDAITVQNLDGRTLAWNPGAEKLYGWTEAEALAMNVRERIPVERREEELEKLHQLSRAEVLEPYHSQRITKDSKVVNVTLISTALVNEAGQMYAVATTERVHKR